MQEMYTETVENAESTLNQTQTVAFQVIAITIAASGLIVFFTMLYATRERTKEIGTLKAIGFSNWNVMSQFVLEGMLISILAGVVGIAIGIVGAPTLTSLILPHISVFGSSGSTQTGRFGQFGDPLSAIQAQATTASLNPQLMLLAVGAAILLGALGSLYPAWRASRTSPMEALRYE
jgi:putative ABC transport system permease protein